MGRRPVFLGLCCSMLAACSAFQSVEDLDPLWESQTVVDEAREERAVNRADQREAERDSDGTGANSDAQDSVPQTVFMQGPSLDVGLAVADLQAQESVPALSGESIQASYNRMPLPAFINTVFGEQLSLPYSLDPGLARQEDLVTLRLVEPIAPADLFRIARRTLADYGVALRLEEGVYTFYLDENVTQGDVPIVISGRALPDVPESHRPVFVFMNLEAVRPNQVWSWVNSAMQGKDLEVIENVARSGIVLRGRQADVEQAMAMVRLLDKPSMRGKYALSIEPAYVDVSELADDLVEILKAEGYNASLDPRVGAVVLLPLTSTNQLTVFSASAELRDHVQDWVKRIDKRQELSIEDGVFSYEVRNTSASYIVRLLNELSGGGSSIPGTDSPDPSGVAANSSANANASDTPASGASGSGGGFVVDTNRNAIMFRGSGQEWAELLPLIKDTDKLPPTVLVEVLLAEISLDDTESSSFQFLANGTADGYDLAYGTLNLLDSGASAFQAVLSRAGETRAILKFLYENRRAEIRSRPRLMVKSGQAASINVGDEVPVVTQSSQGTITPDSPIVNSVVYRSTGVRLEIKPVVHSSGYVDVEVRQELSEAEVNQSSGIDSPTIRNREVQTMVTLRDGGSILLGGLISNTANQIEEGVPLLSAIPGVGSLFKSRGVTEVRRELVIMITPYVMETPEQTQELTELLTSGGTR
ncbi:MAG: secretin N-terminal domain-containing protein [Pseudomonadota bacterium]